MPLTLDESARLAGGHCWAERRLFEITGGWVSSTPEPAVKLMLDRHSQHHAWRAEQWWDRLPVVADVDRDALVVAPTPAAAVMLDLLEKLDGNVQRLAGAYRVALPRLVAAYRGHHALAGPVSDGAVIRTLDIVWPDAASDWAEGEAALQDLLAGAALVDQAAGAVRSLESVLVGEGTSGVA